MLLHSDARTFAPPSPPSPQDPDRDLVPLDCPNLVSSSWIVSLSPRLCNRMLFSWRCTEPGMLSNVSSFFFLFFFYPFAHAVTGKNFIKALSIWNHVYLRKITSINACTRCKFEQTEDGYRRRTKEISLVVGPKMMVLPHAVRQAQGRPSSASCDQR